MEDISLPELNLSNAPERKLAVGNFDNQWWFLVIPPLPPQTSPGAKYVLPRSPVRWWHNYFGPLFGPLFCFPFFDLLFGTIF